MDMMKIMGQMQETQRKIEEAHKSLDDVIIESQSSDGLLKIKITANYELKNIEIADQLLEEKEQLEDYLITTINQAISKAMVKNKEVLDAVTKIDLPMIPGMENMFQ
jgi:DNA-binding YbaB/EbfC family protein